MPYLYEIFCGTKSIGKIFEANGWRVTSVDKDPRFDPTICCDIQDLTPQMLLEASGALPDAIWMSPPCQMYSIARSNAKTPRDMEGSDRIVEAALAIARYFGCPFWMENPHSGYLKRRAVVAGIPMRVLDYCQYAVGTDFQGRYRKRTAIWTNTEWYPARPLCLPSSCRFCSNGKRHDASTDSVGLFVRYSIPSSIAQELCEWLAPVSIVSL